MHILLKLIYFFPSQQVAKSAPLHKATVFVTQPISFKLTPTLLAQVALRVWTVCLPLSFQSIVMPASFRTLHLILIKNLLFFQQSSSLEIQKFWLSELLLQLIALNTYFRS